MPLGQSIRAGSAYVELFTEQSRYIRGLKSAERRLTRFGQHAQRVGRSMMIAGGLMAAPLVLATRLGANFEDQMLAVRAATHATVEEYEHLKKVARELAGIRPFTPIEVAETALRLGRAGFDPAEIEASLEPVMDLARATGTDLVEATEIAAVTMRAMRLRATEMTRVVDVLTTAANGSAQQLTDLGESMKFMAPIGFEAGQSIESVALAAAMLATLGIKGSMAGTGYRRMVASFAEPETLKAIKSLGVEIEHMVDGAKKVRPMVDIMVDLGKATEHLSSLERLALFRELFDLRAMSAGLSLTQGASDVFVTLLKRMKDVSGAAREAAEIQESGLGGAFRLVKSAAQEAAIAIADTYSDALKGASKHIAEMIINISKWVDKNQELVTGYAMTTAAIIAAGAAIFSLGLAASIAGAMLGGIATLLSTLLSPVVLVTAALAILAGFFLHTSGVGGKALDWLGEKFSQLKERATKTIKGISDAMAAGDMKLAAQILWLTLKVEWQKGINALDKIWVEFRQTFLDPWKDVAALLGEFWDGAVGAVTDIWGDFVEYFSSSTLTLGQFWSDYTNAMVKNWRWAQDIITEGMARLFAELQGLDPEVVVEFAQENLDIQRQKQEQEASDRAAENQRRLNELKKGRDAAIAAAAEAQRKAETDRGYGFPKVTRGGDGGLPLPPPVLVGDESRGTFSAFAAQLLGLGATGDNAAERTAKATEKSEEFLGEIKEVLEDGTIIWGRG